MFKLDNLALSKDAFTSPNCFDEYEVQMPFNSEDSPITKADTTTSRNGENSTSDDALRLNEREGSGKTPGGKVRPQSVKGDRAPLARRLDAEDGPFTTCPSHGTFDFDLDATPMTPVREPELSMYGKEELTGNIGDLKSFDFLFSNEGKGYKTRYSATPQPKKTSPIHVHNKFASILSPPARFSAFKTRKDNEVSSLSKRINFSNSDESNYGHASSTRDIFGSEFAVGSRMQLFDSNDIYENDSYSLDGCEKFQFSRYVPSLTHVDAPVAPMPVERSNSLQRVMLPNGMPALIVPLNEYKNGYTDNLRDSRTEDTKHMRGDNSVKTSKTQRRKWGKKSVYTSEDSMKAFVEESVSLELEDMRGRFLELSREQLGCRMLQEKVEHEAAVNPRRAEECCSLILDEVKEHTVEMMSDTFGNYLFQKLVEQVSCEKRLEVLSNLKGSLVRAALNIHGTRSVQKFIILAGSLYADMASLRSNGSNSSKDFHFNFEMMNILINELGPYVTKLSMDTNGNHVIQRFLEYFPVSMTRFVHSAAVRDCLIISRHRHGCCVFQRCIDSADEGQRLLLLNKVIDNAIQLMQDPFGNYVVQYVLDGTALKNKDDLIKEILGRVAELSMQKFSSNVIEKCISQASTELGSRIVAEIIDCKSLDKNGSMVSENSRNRVNLSHRKAAKNMLKEMLCDQYGNYVIQKALTVAEERQARKLVTEIKKYMFELGRFNPACAKKITAKATKRFPDLRDDNVLRQFVTSTSANASRSRAGFPPGF